MTPDLRDLQRAGNVQVTNRMVKKHKNKNKKQSRHALASIEQITSYGRTLVYGFFLTRKRQLILVCDLGSAKPPTSGNITIRFVLACIYGMV